MRFGGSVVDLGGGNLAAGKELALNDDARIFLTGPRPLMRGVA